MTPSFASLLSELLARVAERCPAAASQIRAECRGLAVDVSVGDERFGVRVDGDAARVVAAAGDAAARVALAASTLRALVDGDDEVDLALRAERVAVFADAGALLRLDRFVALLVAGAARSRARDLYEAFAAATERGAAREGGS